MTTEPEKPQAGPELADVARYAAASDPICQQCGAMCDAEEIVSGQLWCYCQSCEMETFHPLMKPHNALHELPPPSGPASTPDATGG
jgi:hypothetical protein